MVLCVACFGVSFCAVFTCVSIYMIFTRFTYPSVATFWERADH